MTATSRSGSASSPIAASDGGLQRLHARADEALAAGVPGSGHEPAAGIADGDVAEMDRLLQPERTTRASGTGATIGSEPIGGGTEPPGSDRGSERRSLGVDDHHVTPVLGVIPPVSFA